MSRDKERKQTKQEVLKEKRDLESEKIAARDQDPILGMDFDLPVYDDQEQYGDDGIFITARKKKMDLRQRMRSAMKTEMAEEIVTEIPKPGESIHYITNGKFDYWTFIPILVGLMGGSSETYMSTWTMNRSNALELMDLYDAGKIQNITFITGDYFKKRESVCYALLITELIKRGQKFKAFMNHAKVTCLSNGHDFLVMEGSANYTSNPRIEQTTITNSKELFYFHADWISNAFNKKKGV